MKAILYPEEQSRRQPGVARSAKQKPGPGKLPGPGWAVPVMRARRVAASWAVPLRMASRGMSPVSEHAITEAPARFLQRGWNGSQPRLVRKKEQPFLLLLQFADVGNHHLDLVRRQRLGNSRMLGLLGHSLLQICIRGLLCLVANQAGNLGCRLARSIRSVARRALRFVNRRTI